MRKIRADMSYLLLSWQDEIPDNSYYLDTYTGNVKLVHRHLFDLRDLTDEIEKDRERYLYIPKSERSILAKDLREFMQTIENREILPILEMAFESPHLLSSFRKILEKDESELKRLEDFRTCRLQARIDEWLRANGYVHDPKAINREEEEENFQDTDDFDET